MRARSADLTDAQEPRATVAMIPPPEQIAAETLAEQPTAREIAFFAGHVPGHGADDLAYARAERGGQICVSTRAWEMVGPVVVKGEVDVERARARVWLYSAQGLYSELRCGC